MKKTKIVRTTKHLVACLR